MDGFLTTCVMHLNATGRQFCDYAGAMLVQIGVLVGLLLLADVLLRRRVRATLRYWLWMLVFIKLLLPPSLCVPTGVGYWRGDLVTLSPPATPLVSTTATLPASPDRPVFTEKAADVGLSVEPDRITSAREPAPTAVPSVHLTWQAGAFLLWVAGTLVFAGWVVQRVFLVRRLTARGHPADGSLLDVLEACRRRVGLRTRVELRLTSEAFSPAVCGLLRPAIFLPAALLDKVKPGGLEAVLIHELAHIKRADLWLNCLQTALQIVYFYNPLVWLAGAMVRRVREQAVDEMVLVALGAEARSYSRTLVDIAEMAFARVSPALRLVGVAESRKSLEGRIRHMITRPTPTNARMGVMGVLVIGGIGALLLPMAQAQRQDTPATVPQETAGQAIATLPDGTTVELVGLCQDPAAPGQRWWRPNGAPMAEPEYDRQQIRHGGWKYPGIGFLLKFSALENLSYKVSASIGDLFAGAVGGSGALRGQAVAYYGRNEPYALSLPDQTDIEVDVAVGEWKVSEQGRVLGSIPPQPTYPEFTPLPDGGVILLSGLRPNPRAESIETLIEATTSPANLEVRLEGTATDGRHPTGWARRGQPVNRQLQQLTFGFDVPIEEIDSIAVKYRPFHPVVFRNVSLRAGHETVVTVQTEASPDDVNRPPAGRTMVPDEAAARLRSAQSLDRLSKAMLIYANDHADKLPESIEDVCEELDKAIVERLRQDVAYLGMGVFATDAPGRVIAYDKTLLARGNGTNVLYLDAHVGFEKPEELKKLGIPPIASKETERVAVMNHLKQFALAMLLYADDHQGTCAPSVQEAKPYLGEEGEFTWAVENIGYLAAGVQRNTVSSLATQPLAYWKTAPPTEEGTAVAFFDGHVEFVKGDRLAELGIR